MTNSREKFEAWFYAFYEPKEWHYIGIEKSYAAWIAGRESMRDEALQECWYDATPKQIADNIRKIQP